MLKMKVKLVLTCDKWGCDAKEEVDGLMPILDRDDIEGGVIPTPEFVQPEGWINGRYDGNYCGLHAWEYR